MKTSISTSSQGFSLVEMLVVISIIGIVSSLAVPSISSFIDTADKAKISRNAQNLASTYSAGLAAGHNFADGETQVADVVQNIVAGASIEMTTGDTTFIGLPSLNPSEQTETFVHLELVGNRLFLKEL